MRLLLLLMRWNVKLKSGADCKIMRKSEKKTAWGKNKRQPRANRWTCPKCGITTTRNMWNSDSDTPGEAKMQILLPRAANVDAMPLRMHKMGMSGGQMFHSCVWYGAVQFDTGLGLTGPCGGMHSTDCHFSWTWIYLSVYPVNDN